VAIDPARPDEVGSALLEYLVGRLGVANLRLAEAPVSIGRGFDTYIYAFRLHGIGLDATWVRPLVLRLYPNPRQADKAQREGDVQCFVARRGYPALEPLVLERNAAPFGLPIMVMERVAGVPMLERLGLSPLAVRRRFAAMADAHVALHRLPVDGCPLPSDGPLVERQLAEFRSTIESLGLPRLEEEFAWLEANRDAVTPEEVSLTHNDFHPQNVIADDDGGLSVIDWSLAKLGDRHHDLAATVVIVRTAPAEGLSLWERLLSRFFRGAFLWRYLRRYRQQLPIDQGRLRYWEALQAFEWLIRLSVMEVLGSAELGIKPDTAQRLPAGQLERLRRYFWQRAGR